jgi:biopolymer transport protein ExbB
MEQGGFDLIGLIIAGGITTYPLVVASIIAFAVVIDRVWVLRGTERAIARLAGALATEGELPRGARPPGGAAGPAALVLGDVGAAMRRGLPREEIDRIAEARLLEALERLRLRLWWLATIGTSAPFIGLFGTVIGVMKSFHFMAESGSGGFGVIAAGISEALVATALGLGVGIVSVGFYNYFEARLDRIEAVLRIQIGRLLEPQADALAA